MELLKERILKDIEIVFEKPRKDITINGDEQRLEQVWINIISNAIKYTDNGGLITIKVKKTSKEVEVSIEDTGRGMSKEVISHILEFPVQQCHAFLLRSRHVRSGE